jgi:gliding motility-associated-like protein
MRGIFAETNNLSPIVPANSRQFIKSMKKTIIMVMCLMASAVSFGAHLKGGWIYYEALGPGATTGTVKYRITVKQYLDCNSTANQIDTDVILGIFGTGYFKRVVIPNSGNVIMKKGTFDPCISPAPNVCYRIDSYTTDVELPESAAGYTLAVQRCCRVAGIVNVPNSSTIGITYSTSIPGSINGNSYAQNNSPQFAQKDTAVVCYNGNFTFDFSAVDGDSDSLVYSFCEGLLGGGTGTNGARPDPPSNPPYNVVNYGSNYSGSSPMGSMVTIDSKTGLISGVAPSQTGDYVVAVCVSEFRNGVKIGDTKKEIHITVANCSLSAAALKPSYISCDGFTMTFTNESTSPLVNSYRWDFGDTRSGTANISTAPVPVHTYSDTGIYTLKLNVESSAGCKDATTSLVRVFPGFVADFNVAGSCFETPFSFTDRTITKYGIVDSWRWDFGDLASNTDTSGKKNDTYKYPTPGARSVQLIVTNSKGCADTISKTVAVSNLPNLTLAFKDTLICSIDTLQLHAQGPGTYSWTGVNLINPTSANPLVFPKNTSTYVVTLNDQGCVATDTVKVNVLDFIAVDVSADTSICRTDSFTIRTTSRALQYQWTPVVGLNNSTLKNPVAKPVTSTRYYVTANLGKCQDRDSIYITVAPYPQANAGSDVSICYGTRTTLTGTIVGSSFRWTPTNGLGNSGTLSPTAGPVKTTSYVLTAFDTVGCPKPFRDTILVAVSDPVLAFAGNDTSMVRGQQLQLNAKGGTTYLWTPSTGLSDATIANPVVTLGTDVDSFTYRVRVTTGEGCSATDDIKIRIFKSGPEIYVPSAFTPNADGRNDVLRPFPVGMKSLNYFRIYNRWGQLIFSTREQGKGWDGMFNGKPQASGTYVYSAEAEDYMGVKVIRKGTIVLIR